MPGLSIEIATGEIATDTDVSEPMWCYMKNGRAPAEWPPERLQDMHHRLGLRELTGVVLGCLEVKEGSVTHAMATTGAISVRSGTEHLVELQFDDCRQGKSLDFRPTLPLILRI